MVPTSSKPLRPLPSLPPFPPFPPFPERDFLPLLVGGIQGVPGLNAFLYFRSLFPGQVFGIGPTHIPLLAKAEGPFGEGIVPADPENSEAIDYLFGQYRFRSVLDASGWCALKPCELDPGLARRMNIDIGKNLMQSARKHGARLVRLSTDLVFDGKLRRGRAAPQRAGADITTGSGEAEGGTWRLGAYTEADPLSPVTVYGKMMAEAEAVILGGMPEAAILRIALPMGPSLNGHAGAIDWIESRFRKGRPATLYFDEVRSNLYVQDLNRALSAFLAGDAQGLYHVGGSRPLSLYNIAQAINRLGNYPPELLMGCLRAHAGPLPPRAGDVTMDCSKAEAYLGVASLGRWPLDDGHVPTGILWHGERDGREAFSQGAVGRYLYGYGEAESWDHPLHLPTVPRPVRAAARMA